MLMWQYEKYTFIQRNFFKVSFPGHFLFWWVSFWGGGGGQCVWGNEGKEIHTFASAKEVEEFFKKIGISSNHPLWASYLFQYKLWW